MPVQMLLSYVATRWAREEGATMVEYGLMVALIAIVALGAVGLVGMAVSALFADVETSL